MKLLHDPLLRPLVVLVFVAFLLAMNGCSAGFWRQCIDVNAQGLYSVSELGILGIGVLRYQRNTAQCKENESPEPAKLPTVKGPPGTF